MRRAFLAAERCHLAICHRKMADNLDPLLLPAVQSGSTLFLHGRAISVNGKVHSPVSASYADLVISRLVGTAIA
jgi:hypothetical protein